jgi:hypothetical protein
VLGIAAVAVAVTGMWNSIVHVEASRLLATTTYGHLLVLKVLLVALAVGLALLAKRPSTRRSSRRVNLLGEGAVLACVAVLGATLAVLPGVLPFPAPIGPLVASGSADGHTVTVVLAPNQPGRNQVTIYGAAGAPAAWLDGDSRGAIALDADAGGSSWTGTAELTAGRSTLHVGSLAVPVDVRRTPGAAVRLVERFAPSAVDAAECAGHVLGQLAAIRDHNATSARTATLSVLAPDEDAPAGAIELPGCREDGGAAKSGEILAAAFAKRGVRSLTVVVDGSDRARGFADAVARAAIGIHVVGPSLDAAPLGDGVLVATGWADAPAVLDRLRAADGAATRPVVLAPWLLHADLLAPAAADASLGQLTVAASIDPTSALARRYLSSITAGQEPSAAGLTGYAEALAAIAGDVPSDQPTTLALFTPVHIQVLPGHDHETTSGWLPTGDLAPVSALLR